MMMGIDAIHSRHKVQNLQQKKTKKNDINKQWNLSYIRR